MGERKHYRACHLCEAICGLEITTSSDQIVSIKGDDLDPFSQGYICPKATALADLHTDPDRLRKPVKKVATSTGDITWQEIEWDEAIELSAQSLTDVQDRYGNDAVGFYAGNPSVHNYGTMTHGGLLRRAIGTVNHFSATSLDQLPHQLAALQMYGHQFFLPVPDIDHTDYFLMIGGNPMASNSSMMTMPNVRGRLKSLRKRGGRLVVIDPRKTETAEVADQHYFITPGSDAYLLLAMIRLMIERDWANPGLAKDYLSGYQELRQAVQPFSLELAAEQTGINRNAIETLVRDMAQSRRAVCHGRMGASVQPFGGICQWAIQVLNILSGSLDIKGGVRLTTPAFGAVDQQASGKGHFNRHQSRVSGLPEFGGELPALCMAEEITTEGDGQIHAMITIAGNPVLSSVDSGALDQAFDKLKFALAIDFYINETTRHADVILPPTGPLEHDHFDIVFHRLAVRDTVRFNEVVFEPESGSKHDWQIFNELAARISEIKGLPFKPLPPPDLMVGHAIENGRHGKSSDSGLTLERIREHPHGLDLGPLRGGLFDRLCTDDGKVQLAPDIYLKDLPRLLEASAADQCDKLRLIGRRHVRSNNSWMHNFHRLVKGKPRWQLFMHPEDLEKRGIESGGEVVVSSRVGQIQTQVEATESVMPGVVCLPHGWGHTKKGVRLGIASKQGGANFNELTDPLFFDRLSGNAALNAIPVTVTPVAI